MAYYVSAIKAGGRKALAIGPFRRHGDAERLVFPVKVWAERYVPDVDHFDTAWGTAHHRTAHPPGRLNEVYGVQVDDEGWVTTHA